MRCGVVVALAASPRCRGRCRGRRSRFPCRGWLPVPEGSADFAGLAVWTEDGAWRELAGTRGGRGGRLRSESVFSAGHCRTAGAVNEEGGSTVPSAVEVAVAVADSQSCGTGPDIPGDWFCLSGPELPENTSLPRYQPTVSR